MLVSGTPKVGDDEIESHGSARFHSLMGVAVIGLIKHLRELIKDSNETTVSGLHMGDC